MQASAVVLYCHKASWLLRCGLLAVYAVLLYGASIAHAQTTELKLETWRIDDEPAWLNQILPAFSASHPQIKVFTKPSFPVAYDAELLGRLKQGTAGDLITCRPFDKSIALYDQGYLEDITQMPELRRFKNHYKIAWTTYYADRVFCMPVAAVSTGFFYNTKIFNELNLSVPKTEDELFQALDTIQRSGKYLPLAFGTQDTWQAAQVLFAGIGPNYWGGEEGRKRILTGQAKFTDTQYVDAWRFLARLGRYLPKQHQTIGEEEARRLFLSGQAAIYPAGSWEIRFMADHPNQSHFGVFAPPLPQGKHSCYVLNHLDKAIGINTQTPHKAQAQAFVEWLVKPEFAHVLANTLHGFFPLTNQPVQINNPLAQEMMSWRQRCDTSIRINSQFLNQAWPQLEQEMWRVSAAVLGQQMKPEEAAQHISSGVEKWYRPL